MANYQGGYQSRLLADRVECYWGRLAVRNCLFQYLIAMSLVRLTGYYLLWQAVRVCNVWLLGCLLVSALLLACLLVGVPDVGVRVLECLVFVRGVCLSYHLVAMVVRVTGS